MLSFKMHHQEFEPPEELRDTIKCFWYNRGDFGERQSSFEVLPDGYAEIIFHFGGALSSDDSGNRQSLPSPFLMGLLNRPVVFNASNQLEIIAIRCFPWTVFDWLELPCDKAGVRLFEHPIAQLRPVLSQWMEAGRLDEALAELKQFSLATQSRAATNGMLSKAGMAMRETNGTMPVSQVAASAHATVRTLERKFKRSSGYTVKDVSGLMRFEQARNHLWLYPNSSLAGLAVELGYTDQSHLSREFKRYSGTTPAAFARKAEREKRVVRSDLVAFVQA